VAWNPPRPIARTVKSTWRRSNSEAVKSGEPLLLRVRNLKSIISPDQSDIKSSDGMPPGNRRQPVQWPMEDGLKYKKY